LGATLATAFRRGTTRPSLSRAGDNPGPGVKILAISAVIGGVVKLFAESGMRLIPDNGTVAGFWGKYLAYMGSALSPALLGVGYIVGLNVGIVVVSGSILTWHIAIPLYQAFFMNTDPALAASIATASSTEAAFAIWGAKCVGDTKPMLWQPRACSSMAISASRSTETSLVFWTW